MNSKTRDQGSLPAWEQACLEGRYDGSHNGNSRPDRGSGWSAGDVAFASVALALVSLFVWAIVCCTEMAIFALFIRSNGPLPPVGQFITEHWYVTPAAIVVSLLVPGCVERLFCRQ